MALEEPEGPAGPRFRWPPGSRATGERGPKRLPGGRTGRLQGAPRGLTGFQRPLPTPGGVAEFPATFCDL